jgi:hypothetical protein
MKSLTTKRKVFSICLLGVLAIEIIQVLAIHFNDITVYPYMVSSLNSPLSDPSALLRVLWNTLDFSVTFYSAASVVCAGLPILCFVIFGFIKPKMKPRNSGAFILIVPAALIVIYYAFALWDFSIIMFDVLLRYQATQAIMALVVTGLHTLFIAFLVAACIVTLVSPGSKAASAMAIVTMSFGMLSVLVAGTLWGINSIINYSGSFDVYGSWLDVVLRVLGYVAQAVYLFFVSELLRIHNKSARIANQQKNFAEQQTNYTPVESDVTTFSDSETAAPMAEPVTETVADEVLMVEEIPVIVEEPVVAEEVVAPETPMAKFCVNCGTPLAQGANFCVVCGNKTN